jgi:DNA-binding MarR family transcriptional regulator
MQAAKDILQAYLRVSRRITEELGGHFGKMNLTFPQTLALTILSTDGPMPISALAKVTGSANSTTSGIVDRLEKAGLLRRVRSETDRRVIYVEVTEKYESIHAQSKNHALERFSKAVSGLNEEELSQVLSGLTLLENTLEQHRKEMKNEPQ